MINEPVPIEQSDPELYNLLKRYCNEQWYKLPRTPIGRNDNCFCNSGKKYKKCCLKKGI